MYNEVLKDDLAQLAVEEENAKAEIDRQFEKVLAQFQTELQVF